MCLYVLIHVTDVADDALELRSHFMLPAFVKSGSLCCLVVQTVTAFFYQTLLFVSYLIIILNYICEHSRGMMYGIYYRVIPSFKLMD